MRRSLPGPTGVHARHTTRRPVRVLCRTDPPEHAPRGCLRDRAAKAVQKTGLPVCMVLLMGVSSCAREDPFAEPLSAIQKTPLPGATWIPRTACSTMPGRPTESEVVAQNLGMFEATVDYDDTGSAQARLSPESGRIASLVPVKDGYLAITSDPSQSLSLDHDLRITGSWSPTPSPGSDVLATTIGPDSSIWILTGTPKRVSQYTPQARHVWSAQLPGSATPSDLAITPDGQVLIAFSSSVAERVDPEVPMNVIVPLLANGRLGSPLVVLDPSVADDDRASLAVGRSPVRVDVSRRWLAVSYPPAGIVDVHDHQGKRIHTLNLCVTGAAREALDRGMELGGALGESVAVVPPPLVSDVVIDEADSAVYVATPVPTADGYLQVTRSDVSTGEARTWRFGAPLFAYGGRLGFATMEPDLLYLIAKGEEVVVMRLHSSND